MVTPFEEAAVQAAVDVEKTRLSALESAGAKFKRIARELCTIAFSDLGDYLAVSDGGEISAIPFSEIAPRKRKALKKIKEHTQIKESADGTSIFKDSRVEFELYDKLDALKYLCKLRGDEPAQKQEHRFPDGVPVVPLTEEKQAELERMKVVLKKKSISEGIPEGDR